MNESNNYWKKCKLKDVANFKNGKAHERDVTDHGDFIIVNSKFISTNGGVKKHSNSCLSPLRKDQITMVMSDVPNGRAIAKCFLVDEDNKYTLNQRICSLEVKKDNPRFLFYLLNRNRYFLSFDNGVGQTNLRKDDILNCPLKIPPIAEQKKIAEILGTCDRQIELTENLINAKRKLKQGLMQKLLTGKLRFPEFEETSLKTVKLGKICNIRRGASPRPISDTQYFSEIGRGWIRIADVTSCQLYLRETTQYLSELGVSKSVKVDPGDLIMSICGTIGVCRIVDIPACIHDGFVLIQPKEEKTHNIFLLYFLNYISEKLSNQGQPGTQKNLNTGIVSRIEIPEFSYLEQTKIANAFLRIDRDFEILDKKLTLFKQQKKALMQQLLTGKTRVKVD